MVCWNDSITRSVELDGGDEVFMEVCEFRLLFRSEMERGIAAPVPTACSLRCTAGSLAVGLVLDGAPLVTVFVAGEPFGETGLRDSGASCESQGVPGPAARARVRSRAVPGCH